jgi:hypothetical protein
MSAPRLQEALQRIAADLAEAHADRALVGGLAVSARTEPRFTRDVDLAVAVTHDRDAEALVGFLKRRGYEIAALVDQEAAHRLATVRLIPPGVPSLVVDLLFASSGIEPEIVRAAELLDVIEGAPLPVATIPHLIATKVLSRDDGRRPQDRVDLVALLKVAQPSDIAAAQTALGLIHNRGFHRGKDLLKELDSLLVG